jgi:hypothetical protein
MCGGSGLATVTYGFHELERTRSLKLESVAIQPFSNLHRLDGIAFVLDVDLHRHALRWTNAVESRRILLLARSDLSCWLLGSRIRACFWSCFCSGCL